MVTVFHCYEFLLLRKLDLDPEFFKEVKEIKDKGYAVKNVPPDLWFLAVTITETKERFRSFVKKLVLKHPDYTPSASDTILSRYLRHCDFVELHLDNVFKHGENGALPKELFRCPNVEVLSLRSNFLEVLPPEIGQLQKLEYLALTNNRLQNSSIPFSLAFCQRLNVLLLDNNLLDALPGFLLMMKNLTTVHRHGNHNYFKSTFMWYHTDVYERILTVMRSSSPSKSEMQSLQFLCANRVIGTKINFFASGSIPQMLIDYLCSIYFDFDICYNCFSANPKSHPGYKVFTFKNPYLGNTCVPFQHWACSLQCAKAIEFPAREEQLQALLEQDRQYNQRIKEAQDLSLYKSKAGSIINANCQIL